MPLADSQITENNRNLQMNKINIWDHMLHGSTARHVSLCAGQENTSYAMQEKNRNRKMESLMSGIVPPVLYLT